MIEGKLTFTEACLKGEAKPEDIDDWVQRWHDSADSSENVAIWDYLGMTGYEYGQWCENPRLLSHVIASRKQEEIDDQRQALGCVIHGKKQKLIRLKNEFRNLEVEIRDLGKLIVCLEQTLKSV